MKNKEKNVIDILEKIADLKFQKGVWLDGKYWDRVSSFEEGVNSLEDYDFFLDARQGSIKFSEVEKQKIDGFIANLLEYEEQDVEKMLRDSVWIKITEEAREVVKILKKHQIK